MHRHDATEHTEVGELLLEDPRVHDQAVAVVTPTHVWRALEDCDVGMLIGTLRRVLREQERFLFGIAFLAVVAVIDDVRIFTLARTALRRSRHFGSSDGFRFPDRAEFRFQFGSLDETRSQRGRKRACAPRAPRAPDADGTNPGDERVACAREVRDREIPDRLECVECRDSGTAGRASDRDTDHPGGASELCNPSRRDAQRRAVLHAHHGQTARDREDHVEQQGAPQAQEQSFARGQPHAEQPVAPMRQRGHPCRSGERGERGGREQQQCRPRPEACSGEIASEQKTPPHDDGRPNQYGATESRCPEEQAGQRGAGRARGVCDVRQAEQRVTRAVGGECERCERRKYDQHQPDRLGGEAPIRRVGARGLRATAARAGSSHARSFAHGVRALRAARIHERM